MNAMIRFSVLLLGILTLESHAALSVITHGPFIGHVTPESTLVWARFALPGTYTWPINGYERKKGMGTADALTMTMMT